MRPDKPTQARNLAALEAALAHELTRTQTMALAAAAATTTEAFTPTVAAWIADWTEYHRQQATNTVARAALAVAIDQVNPQRVAAAVWHLHRDEWSAAEAPPAHQPAPRTPTTPHTPARIKASQPAGKYAPVQVEVDGQPVTVAACVAEVLWDIAGGVRRLKFRPETMRKLREVAPWLADQLSRDHDAKVLANRHTYDVPADLARLVDGTNSGTRTATA